MYIFLKKYRTHGVNFFFFFSELCPGDRQFIYLLAKNNIPFFLQFDEEQEKEPILANYYNSATLLVEPYFYKATFLFITENVYNNVFKPIHIKSRYIKQDLPFICTHVREFLYASYAKCYTVIFRQCVNTDRLFIIVVLYEPPILCYNTFQLSTLHIFQDYSYGIQNNKLIQHSNTHKTTPVEKFLLPNK